MTPQEIHAAVVSLLQQQGLPLTTANLNRGMLALAQNDMSTEGAALPAVNRSMDRTMGAAQQAASRPATAQQSLPTPPIPPTATTQQPPQQVAPTTLELNTPGSLPAGVRNSIEAFLTNGSTQPTPVQQTTPDGSISSLVNAPRPVTLERSAPPNNLYDYEGSNQPVRIPGVTQTTAPAASSTNASMRTTATALTPAATTAATSREPILNTVDQGVSAAQDYLSKLMADSASIVQSLPTPTTARIDARNAQLGTRNAQMQQLEQRVQDQSLPPITQSKAATPTAASTTTATPTTPVEARNAALGTRNTQMQQLEQYALDNAAPSPTPTPAPAAVGNADMRPSTPLYDMSTGNVELPDDSPLMPTASSMRSPTNLVDAMRQLMRQRTNDIMRQNPTRAEMAKTPSSSPSSSMNTNTPTKMGETDPSAPMGKGSTTTPTQSTPAQKQNTATPHTPSQDTSGAGSAIKQSLTKRKQMAASKSTRKSEK